MGRILHVRLVHLWTALTVTILSLPVFRCIVLTSGMVCEPPWERNAWALF